MIYLCNSPSARIQLVLFKVNIACSYVRYLLHLAQVEQSILTSEISPSHCGSPHKIYKNKIFRKKRKGYEICKCLSRSELLPYLKYNLCGIASCTIFVRYHVFNLWYQLAWWSYWILKTTGAVLHHGIGSIGIIHINDAATAACISLDYPGATLLLICSGKYRICLQYRFCLQRESKLALQDFSFNFFVELNI